MNKSPISTATHYLLDILRLGVLPPELEQTVHLALRSPNLNDILLLTAYIRAQTFKQLEAPQERPPALWTEPPAGALRGSFYIARSLPSGNPVYMPRTCLGQRGHILAAGTTGAGKSTSLNFLAVQFISAGIPVTINDTLNQAAQILVPHFSSEQLRVVRNYRRNLFFPPPNMKQIDWIRASRDHLIEALSLEEMSWHCLVQAAGKIVGAGRLVTLATLVEAVRQSDDQLNIRNAVLRRLIPLIDVGNGMFTPDIGFDLEKLFEAGAIIEMKDLNDPIRRLICYDHYAWLTHARKALDNWQLRQVFILHEASSMTWSQNVRDFGLKIFKEARNFGIAYAIADQSPQLEHQGIRANIGTRLIFRLGDPAAIEPFRQSLSLNEEQRNAILNLPAGQMCVSLPDILYPFLAQVPKLF